MTTMIPVVRIIKVPGQRVYLVKDATTGKIYSRILGQAAAIRLVEDEGWIIQPEYDIPQWNGSMDGCWTKTGRVKHLWEM